MKIIIEYQYFGNINLYKNLYKYSYIFFEQCEHYQKSGLRNKMELAAPAGRQLLSIPIVGGRGVRDAICNITICYKEDWRTNHIKTITNLYNRSPFYEFYKNDLEDLYRERPEKLVEWNKLCFEWICSKLKIDAIVAETTSFQRHYPGDEFIDLRYGAIRITEPNTANLPVYSQVFAHKTDFLPNLCILDLLFCEGPNAVQLLANCWNKAEMAGKSAQDGNFGQ